jgi:uncharacterized protein
MQTSSEKYFTLITGASHGIGMALAEECASRGMNLYLASLPGSDLPELAAGLIQKYGVSVEYLEIDLTAENAHITVYDDCIQRHVAVNTLINNVGVGYNGNLDNISEEKVTQMIILNMRTTTLMTMKFLAELKKRSKAYIVNICSLGALSPLPGKSIYSASKAYILFFTKAIRHELKKTGISVSAVFPAGVPTSTMVINRIKKSGPIAKKLVKTPEFIARCTIDGMIGKKELIFPGSAIKALFLASYFLPQGFVLKYMYREFLKAQD